MAGPVGHIVTALMLLQAGALDVEDKSAFIVGTCFPDIRYLGSIKREYTHLNNVTWNDVVNESNSFKAGFLLHSLLDQVREKYMTAHNAYDHIPNTRFRSQTLKLIEDILIYDWLNNWSIVVTWFDTIYPEEFTFNIPQQDIYTWHNFIQTYCKQKPNIYQLSTTVPFLFTNNIVGASVTSVMHHINPLLSIITEIIKSNAMLKRIIFDFYNNTPTLLMQP